MVSVPLISLCFWFRGFFSIHPPHHLPNLQFLPVLLNFISYGFFSTLHILPLKLQLTALNQLTVEFNLPTAISNNPHQKISNRLHSEF